MAKTIPPRVSPYLLKPSSHAEGLTGKFSHIAQVLSQISATLSDVVRLKLECPDHEYPQLERAEWLLLLRQFSAVQTLHASRILASRKARLSGTERHPAGNGCRSLAFP